MFIVTLPIDIVKYQYANFRYIVIINSYLIEKEFKSKYNKNCYSNMASGLDASCCRNKSFSATTKRVCYKSGKETGAKYHSKSA